MTRIKHTIEFLSLKVNLFCSEKIIIELTQNFKTTKNININYALYN